MSLNKKYVLFPVLVIVFLLIAVTSCDYLLPLPLGRDNINDDEKQIISFNVLVSGENTIITTWRWLLPSSGLDDSRKIDRIRIVHRENDPPSTWNPLNQKDMVEINAADKWQHEWTGLNQDRDHFFALYAHEKGGNWLAPVIRSRYLGYNTASQVTVLRSDDNTAPDDPEEFKVWYIQYSPYTVTDFSTMGLYNWPAADIFLIRFKNFIPVYFKDFLFSVQNASPGSDVTLTVYPLYKNAEDVVDWTDLISTKTMDYEHKQVLLLSTGSGSNQVFDIAVLMNRLISLDARTIALSIDNPLSVNPSLWTMNTMYWENK